MQTLKNIWNVISTAILAVFVVFAIALVGVRLFGVDVYTVLSGSMEPTYKTGSVIWVKTCEPEDVQVGDPITFVLDEDLTVATHRVVAIDEVEGEFTTKGDANEDIDGAPVLFENLIGKPVFTVPAMGYFVNWIQNPPGTYMAISIGAVVFILMLLPSIFGKDEGESPKGRHGHGAQRDSRGQNAQAYSRANYGKHARRENSRRNF